MNNFAAFGAPLHTRVLVVRMQDEGGRIEVDADTTPFLQRRFAFIAPNFVGSRPVGDFPEDQQFAHICANDGRMPDGSEPYRII